MNDEKPNLPHVKAAEARIQDHISKLEGRQTPVDKWIGAAYTALRNEVYVVSPNRGEGAQHLLETLLATAPLEVIMSVMNLEREFRNSQALGEN